MPALPFSGWTPSASRTLMVPAPTPYRGLLAVRGPLIWPAKAPGDVLDFVLDPSDWLADIDDVLATGVPTLPPPQSDVDLTALWWGPLNGMFVIFLAGGTSGATVTVNVRLAARRGAQCDLAVTLPISTGAAPSSLPTPSVLPNGCPVSPNSIRLSDSSILTLDSGAPLVFG